MRARLIGLHATDVQDLENWSPGPDFGVSIMVFVAPQDWKGEESFQMTVCSPSWFAQQLGQGEIRSGYHTIFMHEYNYRKLHTFVERAVQRAEAPTWHQLCEQLAWLGHWEFEGYPG